MKKYTSVLLYIASVYVAALLFFGLFRSVLLFSHLDQVSDLADKAALVFKAFGMGFRFDTVIACYILSIPLVVGFFFSFFRFFPKALFKGIHIYSCILFSVTLLVCAANIPYFNVFFKNINASIWNWIDEPAFVVDMIAKESRFWLYIVVFLIIDAAFCFLLYRIYRCFWRRTSLIEETKGVLPLFYSALIGVVVLVLGFYGMRGRFSQKSPIRIGTAFFSNNAFLNQLGLNPNFVLLNTSLEAQKKKSQEVKLMPDEEAIRNVREYLNITSLDSNSPIARLIPAKDSIQKKNVVLILMESMSANHLLVDSADSRVPFLLQLKAKSSYFPNFYSAGIHTYNGVYSPLFSYPALLNQHSMKSGDIQLFACMPATLKKNGYRTLYFSTHDEQFDNIGGFLSANQMEKIIAQKDYPRKEVLSSLGVPDDYMFRFSIDHLKNTSEPFFATFLTASNHQPFIIPSYFTPRDGKMEDQIVEYSDWSLKQFFELVKQENWYENTIFVITGDHGSAKGDHLYDVSLAYHQVPLMIYEPGKEEAEINTNLGGQIDIFPTVMGLLGLEYRNNTFGVDIIAEERPYMFFSSDNSFECIDHEWYYVNRIGGHESLYRHIDKNGVDLIKSYPEIAEAMKRYAASMIQGTQYMIKKGKVQ
ncbi:sulfatase-like hydrolase/transferase [Bacteroidales bacterium OttesenSCG-928-C19]|nr:sulfatase-like hydrolase/transferase [Bacteroidales bacterium OttesenSCG-928-C19]